MSTSFPIPLERYRTISFTQQYLHLFRFAWLRNDFSVSYNFLCFSLAPFGDKQGRIKTLYADHPEITDFDLTYHLEYCLEKREMYISFLDDRFKINAKSS